MERCIITLISPHPSKKLGGCIIGFDKPKPKNHVPTYSTQLSLDVVHKRTVFLTNISRANYSHIQSFHRD